MISLETLPTVKSERWKYTNLPSAVKKLDLSPATLGWSDNIALLNPKAPGVDKYGDTQLWDLNTAQSKDIKFISASDEVVIDAKAGQMLSPRLIVHVKRGQEITLVERQTGQGAYWKNAVTQIVVEDGAILHHYRLADDSAEGVHTNFTHVTIGRDAQYKTLALNFGCALTRHQIHAELQGQGGDCTLAGVNLLGNKVHCDTTITIEHQAPNCTSNQLYKNVLTDSARGIFQGKVHVHQIAQKTDGYQLSNTLMLSPLAEMDTKPELEIYADDVKCSHGATTGQLDAEPLFYMRARGIPEAEARALMIQSFIGEALAYIHDEALRDVWSQKVAAWLA